MPTKFHREQSLPMFFLVLCTEADTHTATTCPNLIYMNYVGIKLKDTLQHHITFFKTVNSDVMKSKKRLKNNYRLKKTREMRTGYI